MATWALDLDGVLWRGAMPIPGAADAVARLRARVERVVFLTNNAAPTIAEHLAQLERIGVVTDPEDLLTSAQAAATMLRPGSAALACAGPGVAEPPAEAEGARFRLFDSTARFLRSAAATRPLVLVLDDLHAADEPSLLLLRFVAGELSDTRLLIVGAYRDVDPTVREPLASALAELTREQVTRRIALGGLTAPDVARYIELSSGAMPAGELAATIQSQTEGNPLFVGEVVRLLAAEGRLSEADVGALWTLGIPQGVREVIGRRLRRRSPGCMDVLTLASVVGREFGLGAMERLSELPAEELLDALDEAVEARLLASVPGSRDRLRFGHALIRETLYEGLTTPRRVQLHRSIGEALEAFYGQDAEPHLAELAHHFFEATPGGDASKALEYAKRAGERAVRLLAYEEAARLYGLALQALELRQPVDAVARCDLLLALGHTLSKAGNTPEAQEAFLAAADLARTSALPEHLARAALGYGGRFPWLRAGRDNRLVPLLQEALEALGDEESGLRVRLLARLAGAMRDQPSLEPRSSLSQQAVDIARRLGDPDTLGYALVSLFTATWGPDVERLLPIAEEVSRLAEETGDSERGFEALLLQHVLWMTVGDTARVAIVADEHQALADELKQASQQWYSTMLRSQAALFRGDFSEAEQLADEALKLGQRAQSWDAGFSFRALLFVLRREQGRLEEIDDVIRASVDEYVGYRSLRCLVAVLDSELGREDEARRAFDELARGDFAALPRDGEWLFCLCLLAEVAAHLNDRDRAATLYDQLLPFAKRNAVVTGDVAVGSVARYLGLLASTTLQWDDAARHFEEALEMNASMGARPWLAHTKYDYARMLLAPEAPGDRGRAKLLLSEALATYQELGMRVARASALALDPTRLGR